METQIHHKGMEKEYLEGYDENEPLRAHKQELADLDELLEVLKVVEKEFSPDIHAREAAENAYSTVLYLMYHLARRFHPLSSYGRDLLLKAESLRKQYERSFEAPMITGINKENSAAFEGFFSPDILECINNGRYRGLGLFRTDVDRLVPTAVAAYEWIYPPEEFEEGPVIDVKWMLVDEEYRGRSLADFLIAELVTLMIRRNASAMNLCVPVDEDNEIWLTLFSEWKFSLETGLNPEFRYCLKDVKNKTSIAKYTKDATCFREIDTGMQDELIRQFLKSTDSLEFFDMLKTKEDYYDRDLSCFIGTEKNPAGILLAHVTPMGLINIEYFDYVGEAGKNVLALLSSCLYNALGKYDKKTEFVIYPETEGMEDFFERIIPVQRVIPMINATLSVLNDIDITEEDVNEMMSAI